MALSIMKPDLRGAYRLIAEHDLYLNESQTKVIVVRDGETVPKEAAFVLAGKGGTIPARYAEMLKALEAPTEEKNEEPTVQVEHEIKPLPEVKTRSKAQVKPEPKAEENPTA